MLTRVLSRRKPLVAVRSNPGHPLAYGLAGCWLLNEGAGRMARDVSRHRREGCFSGGPIWSPGAFGPEVKFEGSDDWISMGDCLDLGIGDVTVFAIVKYSVTSQPDEYNSSHLGAIVGKGHLDSTGRGYGLSVNTSNQIHWQIRNQASVFSVTSETSLNDGQYHLVTGLCDRDSSTGVRLYVDGTRQAATADPTPVNGEDLNGSGAFAIGSRQQESGTWFWDFAGSVAAVYVWNRVLAEAEIRLLQCDPFTLFTRGSAIALLGAPPGGTVECTGSAVAQSGLHARASVSRGVGQAVPSTERLWLREALFNGTTGAAFKLGTTLTQGWFWMRRNGCTALYQGESIVRVDFNSVVHVTEADAREISLLAGSSPTPGSTCYYAIRRFNSCGYQEKTMAVVVVHIAPDGQSVVSSPNAIVGLKGESIDGSKLRLVWFYCPVDQKAIPNRFNIYWDAGSDKIDLEHAWAVIPCQGRKLHHYYSDVLQNGQYGFLIKTAAGVAVESVQAASVTCQVQSSSSEPITILAVKAI
jgi:hypothetical protein